MDWGADMWGQGPQAGFQNALAMGLQFGQMAGQARERRNERNALAAYATDPNEANLKALAPYQPDFVLKQGQAQQAADAEAQLAGLRTRALGGDAAALDELAAQSLDDWKAINPEVKARAAQDTEVLGNAAIQLLNIPYAQRPGQIIAYAQQFPQFAEQIQNIAYLPEAQQNEALRSVVAQAKLTAKLIEIERPSYQVLPQGADLVNTHDPQAVAQFAPSGVAQPVAKSIGGVTYYQNPRTGQWFDSPQEAMGAR